MADKVSLLLCQHSRHTHRSKINWPRNDGCALLSAEFFFLLPTVFITSKDEKHISRSLFLGCNLFSFAEDPPKWVLILRWSWRLRALLSLYMHDAARECIYKSARERENEIRVKWEHKAECERGRHNWRLKDQEEVNFAFFSLRS